MYIVLRPKYGEKSAKEKQSSGSGKEGKFKKSAESEAQEEASETPKEDIETQQKCSEAPQRAVKPEWIKTAQPPKKIKMAMREEKWNPRMATEAIELRYVEC